jgi:hypothetical protein
VAEPVTEASGLAASRTNRGVVWAHNDSGGAASLYALGRDGRIAATAPLAGAENVDWEDMALGPGPAGSPDWLYVGDIGDNGASRGSVRVYRVPEPNLRGSAGGTVLPATPAAFVDLVYPDGPRDAEALVVDPGSGDLFVITKREDRSRVYRARSPSFSGETLTLEYLRDLRDSLVTAADACPDGKTVLVRSYFGLDAYVGSSVASALGSSPSPRLVEVEPQGEAVAAAPDCEGYYTLSEGSGQPLVRYLRGVFLESGAASTGSSGPEPSPPAWAGRGLTVFGGAPSSGESISFLSIRRGQWNSSESIPSPTPIIPKPGPGRGMRTMPRGIRAEPSATMNTRKAGWRLRCDSCWPSSQSCARSR